MKLFLQDLANYLKEIFGESQRVVFTFFDVIGIILFFFPSLAQGLIDDEALARSIGGLMFFISFLLANFNLYRKLSTVSVASLRESSFLLYPYDNPPYNDIEIRYVGSEPVKDLEVWLSYISADNQLKKVQVEQFFPENDPKMIWHQFKANALTEGEIIRFHLLQRKSTINGKVTVSLNCMGAMSYRVVKVVKEFELKL